jgi:hypothetical protein
MLAMMEDLVAECTIQVSSVPRFPSSPMEGNERSEQENDRHRPLVSNPYTRGPPLIGYHARPRQGVNLTVITSPSATG